MRRLEEERLNQERLQEQQRIEKEKRERHKKIKTEIAMEEMRLALTGGKLDSVESIARAVQLDFETISKNNKWQYLEKPNSKVMTALKRIVTKNFTTLNSGFKYYSGLQSMGETSTM